MNSPFKKVIDNKIELHLHKQEEICAFSEELRIAMGLDKADLSNAEYESITWIIDGYLISAQKRCFLKGWVSILEAAPRGTLDPSYGYSNTQPPRALGAGWYYHPGGTTTEILPPPAVRSEILVAIQHRMQTADGIKLLSAPEEA